MAYNLKLYFDSINQGISFFDSGLTPHINSGTITFKWSSINLNKSMSISDFKRNGFMLYNTQLCNDMIEIECSVDLMIGCSKPDSVYRVAGNLPNFSKNGIISNFDKSVSCLFNTDNIRSIDSNLLKNFTNVRLLGNFFSSNKPWRSSGDNSTGNKLEFIPNNLLDPLKNSIEIIDGFMDRMDWLLGIPRNLLSVLTKLRFFSGFNDCKVLADSFGAKMVSSTLESVIIFNVCPCLSVIPTNLINSGGKGHLLVYALSKNGGSNKQIGFGNNIINSPNKHVMYYSGVNLDECLNSSPIVLGRYVNGSPQFKVSAVRNEDQLVTTWSNFINNVVAPKLRPSNDYSDVKVIHTVSL